MKMDSNEKLKEICCNCLSTNRQLYPIYRVPDGVNSLFNITSAIPEGYKDEFFRDIAKLSVCWECSAVLSKQCEFRDQASSAQRQLWLIVDEHNEANRILQNHVRTHTGVGPYQCAYCASTFIQRIALVAHLKSIHT
ncbi:unnamed protein product [Leptidea sinapis]|uniref:C2H2-type domain-containing protein n=1 Tax=Leptidea sinapis TaxID=189913 RepID=A0A5E4QRK3_9NEOP|nr:unnamed protein product [Leptidea sinapis]